MSKIPDKKHNDKELSRLRAQSAMQASNSDIATIYTKKLASKPIVILGYILPLAAPLVAVVKTMTKDKSYDMTDFYIMAIPIILALVIAIWIALMRVLSRHNSAFILIISLLCCFAIVSAVNSDRYLKNELKSMIGKGEPMQDPLLDESTYGNAENSGETIQEALRKAREEQNRERLKWESEKAQRERDAANPAPPNP